LASASLTRGMIIAIVAIVAVALIAVVVLFYFTGDDGNGGNEETWQVGEFVEYGTFYYTTGNFPGDVAGYTRYEITDIDSEWLTIEITYLNPARIELETQTTHVLKNATGFGWATSSISNMGHTITDLGTDTVDSEWGSLSAHHWQYSYEGVGQTITVDIWGRSGFIVLQKSTSVADLQMAIILTNTNISAIYT
jgi:hypothetical protein